MVLSLTTASLFSSPTSQDRISLPSAARMRALVALPCASAASSSSISLNSSSPSMAGSATGVESRNTASTRSSELSSMLPPSIKDASASSMALLAISDSWMIIIDRDEVAVRVALDAGDLGRPRRLALDGRRFMQHPHRAGDLLGQLGRHCGGLGDAVAHERHHTLGQLGDIVVIHHAASLCTACNARVNCAAISLAGTAGFGTGSSGLSSAAGCCCGGGDAGLNGSSCASRLANASSE